MREALKDGGGGDGGDDGGDGGDGGDDGGDGGDDGGDGGDGGDDGGDTGTNGDANLVGGTTTKSPGKKLRIAGMATAGAGAVSLAFGIKFGLDARKISNAITNHQGAWTEEILALQVQGKNAELKMYIFTGVGVAALATGGVLYYLGHKKKGEQPAQAVSVMPEISSNGVGLTIGGFF